jgi:probable rRNA maturation factor
MVKVNIYKQGNFPLSTPLVKKKLNEFFLKKGIVSPSEVSVAIVGEGKMLEVGKEYLGDNLLHNVLSFTPDEVKGKFVFPPDGTLHLGEIIVCYPLAVKEAGKDNVLVNDRVYELIEHGARHLLGEHHN